MKPTNVRRSREHSKFILLCRDEVYAAQDTGPTAGRYRVQCTPCAYFPAIWRTVSPRYAPYGAGTCKDVTALSRPLLWKEVRRQEASCGSTGPISTPRALSPAVCGGPPDLPLSPCWKSRRHSQGQGSTAGYRRSDRDTEPPALPSCTEPSGNSPPIPIMNTAPYFRTASLSLSFGERPGYIM